MSELKEIREKILANIKEVSGQHKEKIEDAYKRVMKLEYIARREGLLALEYCRFTFYLMLFSVKLVELKYPTFMPC